MFKLQNIAIGYRVKTQPLRNEQSTVRIWARPQRETGPVHINRCLCPPRHNRVRVQAWGYLSVPSVQKRMCAARRCLPWRATAHNGEGERQAPRSRASRGCVDDGSPPPLPLPCHHRVRVNRSEGRREQPANGRGGGRRARSAAEGHVGFDEIAVWRGFHVAWY